MSESHGCSAYNAHSVKLLNRPFVLDAEGNPHPRLLGVIQVAATNRGTPTADAFYWGLVIACSAATGCPVEAVEAWLREHGCST